MLGILFVSKWISLLEFSIIFLHELTFYEGCTCVPLTCGSQRVTWRSWVLSFYHLSSCVWWGCQTQSSGLGTSTCLYLLNHLAGLLDFNSINNTDLEQSTPHRVLRIYQFSSLKCLLELTEMHCPVKSLFFHRAISLTEPDSGNTKPRRVGHARKTIPHGSWNQNVGHSLLCHTEAVPRRNTEVSCCVGLVWGPCGFGILKQFF